MRTLIFLLLSCIVLMACNDAADSNAEYMEATDCSGISPTYTADVAPILNTNCALSGCHTALSPSHGLNLQGYQVVKSTFDQHKLLCAINHGNDCNPMPKGRPQLTRSRYPYHHLLGQERISPIKRSPFDVTQMLLGFNM
jgi:hypothetical protein